MLYTLFNPSTPHTVTTSGHPMGNVFTRIHKVISGQPSGHNTAQIGIGQPHNKNTLVSPISSSGSSIIQTGQPMTIQGVTANATIKTGQYYIPTSSSTSSLTLLTPSLPLNLLLTSSLILPLPLCLPTLSSL